MYKKAKKYKPDIKKSFDHYDSIGEVYPFSNKTNYGMNAKIHFCRFDRKVCELRKAS